MGRKKGVSLLLAAAWALFMLTGCQGGSIENKAQKNQPLGGPQQLVVYASFYPMYDFAAKVGGEHIELHNMLPSGTEPHDWEPSAQDMLNLEQADVFIYSGAGMEHWAEDVIRALDNTEIVVVNASQGIELLPGASPAHEGAQHAVSEHDPHVWLNPLYAKKQMENIKDALVLADPTYAPEYERNYQRSAEQMNELDQLFRQTLSALPNKSIVVQHKAFAYLCDRYGLEQMGIQGLSPDQEPDPVRMAEIVDYAREHQVTTIFFEEMASSKVAQTIAKELGAQTSVLNPLEGLSEEELAAKEDYLSVMKKNLQALAQALS